MAVGGPPVDRGGDTATPPAGSGNGDPVVTLRVAGEPYALALAQVHAFEPWRAPDPVPGHGPHVLGVVSWREAIVPVVDLAYRLGGRPTEPGPYHVLVITAAGAHIAALLVDAVIDIWPAGETAPAQPTAAPTSYLMGMLTLTEGAVPLLDPAAILGEVGAHGS